jgi:hypothetical protein
VTPTDDDYDFSLDYLRKAEAITEKYGVSPDAHFAMQCEIAAATYILRADEADYPQLDEQLETLKHVEEGVMASLMAKGSLAHLKDKGVTKENVEEYMERRIAEFEDAARFKNNR